MTFSLSHSSYCFLSFPKLALEILNFQAVPGLKPRHDVLDVEREKAWYLDTGLRLRSQYNDLRQVTGFDADDQYVIAVLTLFNHTGRSFRLQALTGTLW